MSSKFSFLNFKDLTKDGLIKKKLIKEGFGILPVKGQEITINYSSETIDGRFIENTAVVKEPFVTVIGKLNLLPGIEIAIRSMRMGESSTFYISPEYGYKAQDKHKKDENLMSKKDEELKVEIPNKRSEEVLLKIDVKEAREELPIIVNIELIKFDKVRPKKTALSPIDRVGEALNLKIDGNKLYKEKRYNEAIIRYKDGLEYLTQMPSEFLNNKVLELKNSLALNISNSHIGLLEYNYALKNLDQNIVYKTQPKVYYFKAICYMHLGEFDEAVSNLNEVKAQAPNDPALIKAYEELDFLKKKNLNINKEAFKQVIGTGSLYSEIKEKKTELPLFDNSNKCFYIDFLINNDSMNPHKIKFELFKNTENNLKEIFNYINNQIKDSKYKNKTINFDYSTPDIKSNKLKSNLLLEELTKNLIENSLLEKNNIYPPCEACLLIYHNEPELKKCFLEISLEKISDNKIDNEVVIGRCYFNKTILPDLLISKSKGNIIITDVDYSLNL